MDLRLGAAEPKTEKSVYGEGVRPTPWLQPEEERAGFHLPEGFEVQLFAAEPAINKPLNMAWDARGRMWITNTVEYPYPAPADRQPRDSIKVLEDTDGDGAADKITTFAERLNIPIGILPVADGVVCFSIPYIWYLRDLDGDDRVDERIPLLGPFDTTRDTHGMINSLRLGDDGWIYACHGYNNQSRVTARDGSSVFLTSGNIFRFKLDGSSIQQFTHGQVNPFGMTHDEFGNWYTADCHSKPITALLTGACYPSFGRPHDGLGFAPSMMDHLHQSTAICGIQYYQGKQFPEAFRNRFYSGNVMTSRINCNLLQWRGATAQAFELPDFMTSDDPWFRPVDIQQAPDGALYVADFYNKIIGHYEVPLTHPDRDRESGRIWRIAYRGTEEHAELSSASLNLLGPDDTDWNALVDALGSEDGVRQDLAVAALTIGSLTTVTNEQLQSRYMAAANQSPQRVGLLRAMVARQAVLPNILKSALRGPPREQLLALKSLGEIGPANRSANEQSNWLNVIREIVVKSENAHVRQAAVEILGKVGEYQDLYSLVGIAQQFASTDPAVAHSGRIALKALLKENDFLVPFLADWQSAGSQIPIDSAAAAVLAPVLVSLDTPVATKYLFEYLKANANVSSELVSSTLELGVKHGTESDIEALIELISRLSGNDPHARSQKVLQVAAAYVGRTGQVPNAIYDYACDIASQFKQRIDSLAAAGVALNWSDAKGENWNTESRKCDDGTEAPLASSLTRGERYVGTLRSEPFMAPEKLEFFLAGHNGPPAAADLGKNSVRLVDARTGEVLRNASPPRNDRAKLISWSLADIAERNVRLEFVDGDAGNAYAWLAFGRFSLPALNFSPISTEVNALSELVRRFERPQMGLIVEELLDAQHLSVAQAGRLISASLERQGARAEQVVVDFSISLNLFDVPTGRALLGLATRGEALLKQSQLICNAATLSQQRQFSRAMLASATGCGIVQQMIGSGTLSLSALQIPDILLPSSLLAQLKSELQASIDAAKQLPAITVDANARIAEMDWRQADLAIGQQMFKQHCATCHQLAGDGVLVGPQLDGVRNRGVPRLVEDILLPNTNVDRAFLTTSLLLDDDRVLAGLVRDLEDGRIELVTQDGKSQFIQPESIVQRKLATTSLMPSNFSELLSSQQLASLLLFLARTPSATP
ncbi:MAG: c-type cytochrome [Planctomycetales bacterium]|nr:c-type cytochrome [Planctomycetales bacterium]